MGADNAAAGDVMENGAGGGTEAGSDERPAKMSLIRVAKARSGSYALCRAAPLAVPVGRARLPICYYPSTVCACER